MIWGLSQPSGVYCWCPPGSGLFLGREQEKDRETLESQMLCDFGQVT